MGHDRSILNVWNGLLLNADGSGDAGRLMLRGNEEQHGGGVGGSDRSRGNDVAMEIRSKMCTAQKLSVVPLHSLCDCCWLIVLCCR